MPPGTLPAPCRRPVGDDGRVRVAIRVRPAADRTAVGPATSDPTHGRLLVVRVREPAVEGRANEAALRALAQALGVRRSDVTLTRSIGRVKFIEVDAPDDVITRRVEELAQHSDPAARLDSR
ncbi:protein of unknown function DUF167 [Parafrankia sp. EAN1pec]|nr:protein of unknown function DUF167 [Frankia sp. EAN1pec]